MNNISEKLEELNSELKNTSARLIAVSKTKPKEMLKEAYEAGQRHFGENKAQEMTEKSEALPNDIFWHMIGHMQRNKVKYIAPYVHLIHSVDSLKLLTEINKQGEKNNRVINCLLQVHIAKEETKFGFDYEELIKVSLSDELASMNFIKIIGLMGMATFTTNQNQIADEFGELKNIFEKLKNTRTHNFDLTELSMGMSGDYKVALEHGSTMIRVGSSIFGERNYA